MTVKEKTNIFIPQASSFSVDYILKSMKCQGLTNSQHFLFDFFAHHLVVPQGTTILFTHRNAKEENKS